MLEGFEAPLEQVPCPLTYMIQPGHVQRVRPNPMPAPGRWKPGPIRFCNW